MLVLVLSKIRPLKGWDFVNKRRFPVSSPRFTVVFPDFQRNNTQGGDCPDVSWDEKIWQRPETRGTRTLGVWWA